MEWFWFRRYGRDGNGKTASSWVRTYVDPQQLVTRQRLPHKRRFLLSSSFQPSSARANSLVTGKTFRLDLIGPLRKERFRWVLRENKYSCTALKETDRLGHFMHFHTTELSKLPIYQNTNPTKALFPILSEKKDLLFCHTVRIFSTVRFCPRCCIPSRDQHFYPSRQHRTNSTPTPHWQLVNYVLIAKLDQLEN